MTAIGTTFGLTSRTLATCYYRRDLIFLSYLTCHYTSIVPCINHRKSKKITLLVPLGWPNFRLKMWALVYCVGFGLVHHNRTPGSRVLGIRGARQKIIPQYKKLIWPGY